MAHLMLMIKSMNSLFCTSQTIAARCLTADEAVMLLQIKSNSSLESNAILEMAKLCVVQNLDRGGTVAAPRRASQTGSAENPDSVSGTIVMNQDMSGTMVMNSVNPSGTVLADEGRGGTLLVAPGGDLPGVGLGTVAERGEDFAAALRSNAPAETSGYVAL